MTELWGLAPVLAAVRNDVPGRGAGKAQCSGAQMVWLFAMRRCDGANGHPSSEPALAQSERIFGDDVFAAELEDVEYTAAFLLGSDIGAFTTVEDSVIVNDFLKKQWLSIEDLAELDRDDPRQREAYRFQMQLRAFGTGYSACPSRRNALPPSWTDQ